MSIKEGGGRIGEVPLFAPVSSPSPLPLSFSFTKLMEIRHFSLVVNVLGHTTVH